MSIAALGSRALDLDFRLGKAAAPILWDDAHALWRKASGSPLELRGALVLLALADATLRPWVVEVAGSVGYEAARVADLVYLRLSGDGLPVRDAPAVLLSVVKPAPATAPTAAPPAPDDLYPGLLRNGEPWGVWNARVAGSTSMDVANQREEWKAAAQAYERGEAAAWVAACGAPLGFTWTPPTTG